MINIIYKLYIWILYTLLPCCYSILQYNITASHTAWMMLRVPQVWSCIIPLTRSWTTLSCVRYWRFLRWSRTWMSRPVPPVSQQTCSPSSRLHPAPIRGNFDTGKQMNEILKEIWPKWVEKKRKCSFYFLQTSEVGWKPLTGKPAVVCFCIIGSWWVNDVHSCIHSSALVQGKSNVKEENREQGHNKGIGAISQ